MIIRRMADAIREQKMCDETKFSRHGANTAPFIYFAF